MNYVQLGQIKIETLPLYQTGGIGILYFGIFAIIGICNLADFMFGNLTIFFSVAESMELAEAC